MTLYVLDTDILTLWLSGHASVSSAIASTADDQIAVSIVSVEEMLTGWYTQIRRARNDERQVRAYRWLQDTVEVVGQLHVLSFGLSTATRYRDLRRAHRRVGANDLKIAATVIENVAVLVTRNLSDFAEIEGLRCESWAAD